MGWHMFEDYGYMDRGWSLFGGMFLIFFFSILFLGLLTWILYISMSNKNVQKDESAENIAKERYAKGEITREEYEDIIKTLKK